MATAARWRLDNRRSLGGMNCKGVITLRMMSNRADITRRVMATMPGKDLRSEKIGRGAEAAFS